MIWGIRWIIEGKDLEVVDLGYFLNMQYVAFMKATHCEITAESRKTLQAASPLLPGIFEVRPIPYALPQRRES